MPDEERDLMENPEVEKDKQSIIQATLATQVSLRQYLETNPGVYYVMGSIFFYEFTDGDRMFTMSSGLTDISNYLCTYSINIFHFIQEKSNRQEVQGFIPANAEALDALLENGITDCKIKAHVFGETALVDGLVQILR